jgi:hypothetical protein
MDDVVDPAGHRFLLSVMAGLDISMLSLPGLPEQSKISVTLRCPPKAGLEG